MIRTSATTQLHELADRYWSAYLARNPVLATTLAVHDHDEHLDDLTPEARERWLSEVRALKAELMELKPDTLETQQQVTRDLLLHEMETQFLSASLDADSWLVDQLGGPQVALLDLPRLHRLVDRRSLDTFLARVRAIPAHLDQHGANLRRGLARNLVAARCSVERVLQQLRDTAAGGRDSCALWTGTSRQPSGVGEAEFTAFRSELSDALSREVLPAFERYERMLRAEVLPASREVPGLHALPRGAELYRNAILLHVTLDRSPEDLHALGLLEVERNLCEMRALAAELLPGRSFEQALRELRSDKSHSFSSREEIVAAASGAVKRATVAASSVFSLLPNHECIVQPIDAHMEKAAPAAFYLPPAPDGTRPGTYFINTYAPESRPRHETEVVAFHEAVPGHHLQIALAQELSGVPEFQRHAASTAYVEGWALYTESLANEMGLYSGPWDLLGMYGCDAWRAARLVVDTGLHAFGWSRQRAIDFMAKNTAASLTDIEAEVDRYVTWPGQALSYKVGQLEIQALRRSAEEAFGDRFEIKAFHRVVMEHGGLTLPILRSRVEAWIASAAAR